MANKDYFVVKDWDGSFIFRKASIEQIAIYFDIDCYTDISDIRNKIKHQYKGLMAPTITAY